MKISDIIVVWKKYSLKRKKKIFIRKGVVFHKTFFEGNGKFGKYSRITNSFVGKGTYIGIGCDFNSIRIGRFCSIGDFVKVYSGNHPIDFISTHPAFYSSMGIGIVFNEKVDFISPRSIDEQYNVEIGNDVWIGSGVIIQGG